MFLALVGFGLVPAVSIGIVAVDAGRRSGEAHRREALEAVVARGAEAVDLFLEQRLRQLELLAASLPTSALSGTGTLEGLRAEMARDGGAIIDLGLIDRTGRHLAYAGPYDLLGYDYSGQPWFEPALVLGRFQSDLFLGFRRFPHVVLVVRKRDAGGDTLLRATVDTAGLNAAVGQSRGDPGAEVFVLNRLGECQATSSPSRRLMDQADVTPPAHAGTRVVQREGRSGPELVASRWLKGGNWVVVAREPFPPFRAWLRAASPLPAVAGLFMAAVPLLALLIARSGYRRVRALEEERAALYQSVAQSEKLAAIGRLATTTAHEINNPLAIIDAQVGLLNDMLVERAARPSDGELQERLQKISAQVQRGKTVTHRLLGFSRRVGPVVEAVDIVGALEETVAFVEKEAETARVRLVRDYQPGTPLVRSNLGQMQQVFFNVLSNAIDAVGHDGEVQLAIRCGRGGVEVTITDTGPGIPESDLERVFEPFYSTTSRESRHCGLGLAICRETMRTLGGRIIASNEPGRGASFTLWFPLQGDAR